jgi:predicted ATPase
MDINLRNIGMIKSGNINLNGLVVLAGENDTGKSTVGKLLFSIIRTFGKYEEEFEEDRDDSLEEKVRLIYFELRKYVNFSEDSKLRRAFDPGEFLNTIQKLLKESDFKILGSFLDDKKIYVQQLEITQESKANIIYQIDEIIKTLSIDSKHIDVKKRSLNKALLSEFAYQVTNFITKEEAVIDASEGDNLIFHLSIKDNKVNKLELHDEVFYNDVTYIETPLVLQYNNYSPGIVYSLGNSVRRRNRFLPLHVSDLLTKLQSSSFMEQEGMYTIFDLLNEDEDKSNKLDVSIRDLIGGSFIYRKNERDFIFKKGYINSSFEVKLPNVATGIKSFGLIQMLLKSGVLNQRSLLIIDEPEVHLHPSWQIKYAELLVLLVKEIGLNVLIASHSPYFIEAIKVFSDKYGVGKNTKFYLTEKDSDNTSIITNVTDSLEKIFDKLTEPFNKLEDEAVSGVRSYDRENSEDT